MAETLPIAVTEELVRETIRQLKDKGYTVNQDSIYQAINTANVNPISKKMQFKISKREEFDQDVVGPGHNEFWFFPRRILLNTTTDYKPNTLTRIFKNIEARYFDTKTKGFDSSHFCRCAREELTVLGSMQKAYARGSPYSLMGTIGEIYGMDEDGRVAHDEKGELYVRAPVIIIPGAESTEIRSLDAFCKQFQIPSQEKVNQVLGITD